MVHRWSLQEDDLMDLTPVKARDLIINCFYEAQNETFARSKQSLGLSVDEKEVRKNILSTVRLAFKETEEDFDNPTKKGLLKVTEVLYRKSTAWGTTKDIIDYHRDQIMRVIEGLK